MPTSDAPDDRIEAARPPAPRDRAAPRTTGASPVSELRHAAIARIEYGATFGFSFVIGTLLSLVPSLVAVLAAKWLVSATLATMEHWVDREVLSIMGQSVSVNMVDVLGLTDQLARLQAWDALGGFAVILAVLLLSLLGGLVTACFVALATAAYNVTARYWRGIRVDLRVVD